MLKIENLTKTYNGEKGVRDLSLHIAPGEIYGFIGHNGAGKTTTLKSVAGIHGFEKGNVLINGISIKDDPIAAKKIMAYIPDNPDIYDFMKGMDYLNFVCHINHLLFLMFKSRFSLALVFCISLDNVLNQLMANNILCVKGAVTYALDVFKNFHAVLKSAFGASRKVNLRYIACNNHF